MNLLLCELQLLVESLQSIDQRKSSWNHPNAQLSRYCSGRHGFSTASVAIHTLLFRVFVLCIHSKSNENREEILNSLLL